MQLHSRFRRAGLLGLLSLFILNLHTAHAGSATWNPNATSDVWYISTNWIPASVPNTLNDTATFGVSNITSLYEAPSGLLSDLGTFYFTPGASAYTISFAANLFNTDMIGAGVINDSGVLQSFSIPASSQFRDENGINNTVSFINSATAGSLTQWTVGGSRTGAYRPAELKFNDSCTGASSTFILNPDGSDIGGDDGDEYGGQLGFLGSSTADQSTIIVSGGAGAYFPAQAYFTDNATAASAIITTTGGTIPLGREGYVVFLGSSTAANATITNQGGAVRRGRPGQTTFSTTSNADNATVIANGGPAGAEGGLIQFNESATGGTARCEMFGNGTLDISLRLAPGVTVGSIEGDGIVSLGARALTVGSNDLSTTFSGVIQDGGLSGGRGGALTKIGRGDLTLTNANIYTGGTIITDGILLANNTTGSATGIGRVRVMAGTLGGSGIIGGAVVVGTGSGSGAILGPGNGNIAGTLTIQKKLTLKRDATYRVLIDSGTSAADQVTAKGITIRNALIQFQDHGAAVLPPGTAFTVIENSAATSIAGTFSNLPDGSTLIVGNNNFQVDYEGGDGNDLTLTVVP